MCNWTCDMTVIIVSITFLQHHIYLKYGFLRSKIFVESSQAGAFSQTTQFKDINHIDLSNLENDLEVGLFACVKSSFMIFPFLLRIVH